MIKKEIDDPGTGLLNFQLSQSILLFVESQDKKYTIFSF
jgi:hypothetical protein